MKPLVFKVWSASALPENSQLPMLVFGSMNVNSKIVSPSGVQIRSADSSSPSGPFNDTNWISSDAE